MTVTRTSLAPALLLAASACAPTAPSSAPAPPPRIAFPGPGIGVAEPYPPPSLPAQAVKRAVFERINRDRARERLSAVAWDEGASRVADAFCAAQVAERTRGHFLRDGVPPYARTAFAGVFGYQAENSASWIATGGVLSDAPEALALSSHDSMLGERPPNDGHRRTILDPEATHVGVGWAAAAGRFQLAEEFLARGLERLALRGDSRGAAVRVEGAARKPLRLHFVTVGREPLPRGLSREEATARTTYRYPPAAEAFVFEGHKGVRVVGAVTEDRIQSGPDRAFSFVYAPPAPGLYTFVFWLARADADPAKPLGSAVICVVAGS